MEERPQRSASDFSEIISSAELPLVVGGQAVNLWAEIYSSFIPDLEAFEPFVSKDADIFGSRELAQALSQQSGWECKFIESKDSIVVAVLSKTPTPGSTFTVEVLREVNGLSDDDLALSQIIERSDGSRVRIPSPLVLLRAKLYNLASLTLNERPQDRKHVRMLAHIVPAYMREIGEGVRKGDLSPEVLAGALQYARTLQRTGFAKDMAKTQGLSLSSLIPLEIEYSVGSSPTKNPERERER